MWDGGNWQRLQSGPDETLAWTTEASTEYVLASNGATTTVTTAASDPEGFPIEYSHQLTPASPNQVTSVVDNNDGTYTLTPSTNNAHAGSFTLRTIASDGLYNVSKNSTFSLSFVSGPDLSAGSQDATSYDWTNIGQSLGGYGELLGGMHWKPDGSKFVITFRDAGSSLFMESWSTSTAFSLASADVSKDSGYWTPTANSGMSPTPWGNIRSTGISDDGTKVYLVAEAGNLFQYSLGTGWDLTSNVASTGTRIAVNGASHFNYGSDRTRAITFGNSGNYVYVLNDTEYKIYQASLSTAWDLTSTFSNIKSLAVPYTNFSNGSNSSSSFQINSVGTGMIIYYNDGKMQEYSLSTDWDITSATNSSANDISKTYSFNQGSWSYFPAIWFNSTADTLFYTYPTSRTTGTIYKLTGV